MSILKYGGSHIAVNSLPKSASLVEIDIKIKELGLESIAETFMVENFGVYTMDELLERERVYEFVQYMSAVIATMEKTDGD